ncbi:DUF3368 domain-containing protein [Rubrivirga sp.]|uniref:DUF3368 domain-containing protein n=1 Tax=Rubrivirga sp. TaxID=1885344 RepID=UPI003C77D375
MKGIVVTDTSPLIALERVGKLDLLPGLYSVVAPSVVVAEFGSKPDWLRIEDARDRARVAELAASLDDGESEAIALALETPGRPLLIDEIRGRRAALRFGLEVIGTLGVLIRAQRAGLIPAVRPLLDELREAHGFRASDAIVAAVLRQAGEG